MTHIQYLTAGKFGVAVATKAGATNVARLPVGDMSALQGLVESADFVAVALWRPYQETISALNKICHRLQKPWSLAEMHGTRLTIGPLTIPVGKGCYDCYLRRWGAHHPSPARETVLQDFYCRHLDAGPEGYSPSAVAFAAAGLIDDARVAMSGQVEQAGRIRVVDVLGVSVLESQILPVHGCSICFPQRSDQRIGDRFTRHLVPALNEALR